MANEGLLEEYKEELEGVRYIRGGNMALLDSLLNSEIVDVEWKGRYSRSGRTYYLSRVNVRARTRTHEHELRCAVKEFKFVCSHIVDGEEVGILEIDPYRDLGEEILSLVDVGLRATEVSPERVSLSDRPTLTLEY